MKKGKYILLSICLASLFLILGVFVGRNLAHPYKLDASILEVTESGNFVQTDILPNINEMTKTQLMARPGIGETIAERIITYRNENGPFAKMEELLNVEGIGEKKLEQIIDLVGVGG